MAVNPLVKAVVSVSAPVLALLGAAHAQAQSFCLQDQFGNQYNMEYDAANLSLFGSAVMAQCNNDVWPLVGGISFSVNPGPGVMLHVTVANSVQSIGCRDIAMLRGILPDFEWYLETGYAAQPASWVACGTAVSADATTGGAVE